MWTKSHSLIVTNTRTLPIIIGQLLVTGTAAQLLILLLPSSALASLLQMD
jgi:hypothetical protein